MIHELGVPTTAGRTAAIRQHLVNMHAPIVAAALGYRQVTAARLAAEAGNTWTNYASGGYANESQKPGRTADIPRALARYWGNVAGRGSGPRCGRRHRQPDSVSPLTFSCASTDRRVR